MFKICFVFALISTTTICLARQSNRERINFRNEKELHFPKSFSDNQIRTLAELTDVSNINEILDNILIVRNVGSPGHDQVKDYITKSMTDLGWSVEIDEFEEKTPNLGILKFENIISTLNPNARRYLALACHYDSKYFSDVMFVGATDSAVPCAQLINLATVMQKYLKQLEDADVSLMFIFFDGEEAFVSWTPQDSIYGARHLATKWDNLKRSSGSENDVTHLDRIDILVLLDLLGAPEPRFYSYFPNTARWYLVLSQAEDRLKDLNLLERNVSITTLQKYFKTFSRASYVEDDHIPFFRKNVSILHIIPSDFPDFWHDPRDNRDNIDIRTIENLNKIFRVFIASYFWLDI